MSVSPERFQSSVQRTEQGHRPQPQPPPGAAAGPITLMLLVTAWGFFLVYAAGRWLGDWASIPTAALVFIGCCAVIAHATESRTQ